MDLKTVENKIFLGTYQLPEDFEYDVNLIFKNCEAYNVSRFGNQAFIHSFSWTIIFSPMLIKTVTKDLSYNFYCPVHLIRIISPPKG